MRVFGFPAVVAQGGIDYAAECLFVEVERGGWLLYDAFEDKVFVTGVGVLYS